jgi:hypothetical protein
VGAQATPPPFARARQIADNMPLYVFPTRTGNPIGLGNNRQADIVDMRNGYFSNNPLGLWIHIWVSYTDRAFKTSDGKKMLEDLRKADGAALEPYFPANFDALKFTGDRAK